MSKVCNACGWKTEKDAKFCENCGGALEEIPNKKPKAGKKKIFIGAAIVFIIALVGYIMLRPPKIDLEDYLGYEMTGYNGKGYCVTNFDYQRFEMDVKEILNKKLKNKDQVGEAVSELYNAFDITLSPSGEKLSNGDKVTIEIKVYSKLLKDYDIRFAGKKITVKVKDLPEAERIDVFKDFKLNIQGIAPFAEVEDFTQVKVGDIYVQLTCLPNRYLGIGDTVVVTVDEDSIPEGYIVEETEKSFKVEDVDHYILDAKELTTEDLEIMKNACLAELKKSNALNYRYAYPQSIKETGSEDSLRMGSDLEKSGNLNILNDAHFYADGSGYDSINRLVLGFELDAVCDDEWEKDYFGQTFHLYSTIQLQNIYRKTDGSIRFEQYDYYGDRDDGNDVDSLFVDVADLNDALEGYYNDYLAAYNEYTLTLDGSVEAELVRKAAIQNYTEE